MGFTLQKATLNPPALPPGDDDAGIPWVLLDEHAYVAERHNATTAVSTTWNDKKVQVTFCLAHPPRVSYLCVFCPEAEITLEPKILATEDDIVLLRIIVSSRKGIDILKDADDFVYEANAAAGPSLTRLPRPPSSYGFESYDVGILRCRTNHGQRRSILRAHRDNAGDFYVVAGLCKDFYLEPGQFVLCLYNSKQPGAWSINTVSLDEQQRLQHGRYFHHVNTNVISVGGDNGTMGFVDLWHGILFCDVLRVEASPMLRYVTLPPPILPVVPDMVDARLFRDIAVIGDRIKYVELQVRWEPCPVFEREYIMDGWESATWSRPVAATSPGDDWDLGFTRKSSHVPVDSNPHFELLPRVLDDGNMPVPPFRRVHICQPTLSLQDGDTVYFMTKIRRGDAKAWVIAVDMRNNALQGVAEFAAERTTDGSFTYVHSRISKYLTMAPGNYV
ncbi:hypothetical protein ACP70R_012459 [Stipagrostis hirtigluma subsp. patula]